MVPIIAVMFGGRASHSLITLERVDQTDARKGKKQIAVGVSNRRAEHLVGKLRGFGL
jgi:hypothetical protein